MSSWFELCCDVSLLSSIAVLDQCRLMTNRLWSPNDQLSGVNWLPLLYLCVCKSARVRLPVCRCLCEWVSECVPPTGTVCSVIQVMQSREWKNQSKRGGNCSLSIFSLSVNLFILSPVYWSMGWSSVLCLQLARYNLVTSLPRRAQTETTR